MTEETEAIFASMGLSTTWRGAGELDLMLEEEVTVILVPHTSPNPERRGRTVLGATPLGAQVHRKVWVHAPDVLRATGTSVRFRPGSLTPRDEARFVRALARVIVHEVIHALSPDLPHGEGVMSECLTRKLLTSGPLLIAAEVRAAVHAALDRNGSRRRGAGASKPAVVAGSGAGDGASSDISHQ